MDEWLAEPSVWNYHAPVPDSRIVTGTVRGHVAQRPYRSRSATSPAPNARLDPCTEADMDPPVARRQITRSVRHPEILLGARVAGDGDFCTDRIPVGGVCPIESDNQLRRFPPSFLRTCGRPPHVATTTSISPSLSRSPNAAPRPTPTPMRRSCCRRWNETASNIPEDERRLKILEVIGRQLYRIEDVTLRDEQILPPVIVEIDPPDAPARMSIEALATPASVVAKESAPPSL